MSIANANIKAKKARQLKEQGEKGTAMGGLSRSDIEAMVELKQRLGLMSESLAGKAELTDVRALADQKTNKIDSEAHSVSLEVLHRMITNLAVLTSELAQAGLTSNPESKSARAHAHNYIYEQTCNVGRWIQSYDTQRGDVFPSAGATQLKPPTSKYESTLSSK